jgi:hypothetical protein
VPVQTVAAPAPAAAAPVQFVAAPTASAPVQYVLVKAHHPHKQYLQAQVAAAPVQFVTTQAAAAPVQFVTTQAAAAPVQFVQMQVAAPVNTTNSAAAPVAGAPQNPPGAVQIYVNGVLTKYVPAASPSAVAGAPDDDGGLSADDRKNILKQLAPFVTRYKDMISDKSDLRSAIRGKASDLYEQVTSKDASTAEGGKAVDSIVDEALGAAPDTTTRADDSKSGVAQTQQVMVPVTSAAPMQLFLPVKVKHHGNLLFK